MSALFRRGSWMIWLLLAGISLLALAEMIWLGLTRYHARNTLSTDLVAIFLVICRPANGRCVQRISRE